MPMKAAWMLLSMPRLFDVGGVDAGVDVDVDVVVGYGGDVIVIVVVIVDRH